MWRMHDGDRVFTGPEWELFAAGLDLLRDQVEQDIEGGTDDTQVGVRAFDVLTAEQKLALLASVARALRDEGIPTPRHTAANEGAVMAVFLSVRELLEVELEMARGTGGSQRADLRRLVLTAVGEGEREEPLPELTSTDPEPWEWLLEEVEGRVFWDVDFELGDEFLDLPPEEAKARLRAMGIDPGYYRATPPDPDEQGLIRARQTLAGLLGHPAPDDDGLFLALDDLYHDLCVGPISAGAEAEWWDHPWVTVIGQTEPDWDCDYATWRAQFAPAMPAEPFRVEPAGVGEVACLPPDLRVERVADGWVVRGSDGTFWCGLVENGWAQTPDEEDPSLVFPTEADARSAFSQASRMYAERGDRQRRAFGRLGIEVDGAELTDK